MATTDFTNETIQAMFMRQADIIAQQNKQIQQQNMQLQAALDAINAQASANSSKHDGMADRVAATHMARRPALQRTTLEETDKWFLDLHSRFAGAGIVEERNRIEICIQNLSPDRLMNTTLPQTDSLEQFERELIKQWFPYDHSIDSYLMGATAWKPKTTEDLIATALRTRLLCMYGKGRDAEAPTEAFIDRWVQRNLRRCLHPATEALLGPLSSLNEAVNILELLGTAARLKQMPDQRPDGSSFESQQQKQPPYKKRWPTYGLTDETTEQWRNRRPDTFKNEQATNKNDNKENSPAPAQTGKCFRPPARD